MRLNMQGTAALLASALLILGANLQAKVSADQAAKLGDELTPIGAKRAGDGKIPAWDGGLDEPVLAFNPYRGDEVETVITADNVEQYKEHLSAGQLALFKAYPDSYKMKIFPTRRSAAFPEFIYEQTKKNATRAQLVANGNGFTGATAGFPFPIPQSGAEAMWNHIVRYNTKGYRGYVNHAVVSAGGDWVRQRVYFEVAFRYNTQGVSQEDLDNELFSYMEKVVEPAHQVGSALLYKGPLNFEQYDPRLWVYTRELRRIRRVGKVGYDNPFPHRDNLITTDQADMFNGALDRYNWKLLGKKDMYVPYNSYGVYSDKYSYDELINKGHINQNAPRYELHRCWVVEATVKDGISHLYPRRVFYIDEDSWLILLEDMFDERGELWRYAEAHAINVFFIPFMTNPLQVHYDLNSRRYVVLNMTSEEPKLTQYDWTAPSSHFNARYLEKFVKKNFEDTLPP